MQDNKKDNRKLGLLLVASLSVIVLIFCVVRLAIYKLTSYKTNKEVEELEEQIKDDPDILPTIIPSQNTTADTSKPQKKEVLSKYSLLYEQNKDFAGWIRISGTNISYPVMKNESDGEYYLHRNFNKASSDEGLPFIDSRCDINTPSNNIIIYGHNMKNGDMFADLLKYDDPEYLIKHDTISFDTIYEEGTYTIISVLRTDVSEDSTEDFKFYEFIDESVPGELEAYIRAAKEASLYSIPFDETQITGLLTLSTCEYTKKDGRFVIIAAKNADIIK